MDEVILGALEVALTAIGRFAVWVFTLGAWRGESLGGEEGKIYGAAGALSFVRDGRRVVTCTGQLFAGIAFCVLLAGGVIAYAIAV